MSHSCWGYELCRIGTDYGMIEVYRNGKGEIEDFIPSFEFPMGNSKENLLEDIRYMLNNAENGPCWALIDGKLVEEKGG